jgi:transposase InsO family protein
VSKTRRLRELTQAASFALFFSDDAVGVEATLHREFADQRPNKVNLRNEFFRVEPQAVLDALNQHNVAVLEFKTHVAAYESTEQRNDALPGWLHFYHHHRAHSAIGGRPPITG